jgi:hypothetical protein
MVPSLSHCQHHRNLLTTDHMLMLPACAHGRRHFRGSRRENSSRASDSTKLTLTSLTLLFGTQIGTRLNFQFHVYVDLIDFREEAMVRREILFTAARYCRAMHVCGGLLACVWVSG